MQTTQSKWLFYDHVDFVVTFEGLSVCPNVYAILLVLFGLLGHSL